jgi:transposase-like protein
MAIDLSPEEWARVRYEYEQTDKPVDDICLDHGFSAGTLRDRVRRWGWTRRNAPIAAEGPPLVPPIEPAAPLVPAATPAGVAPEEPALTEPPPDPVEIVPRLQRDRARAGGDRGSAQQACRRADASA